QGEGKRASACAGQGYSYAGLQAADTGYGVAATLTPMRAPNVTDGHVGGWVGVGGTHAGPGGGAGGIQGGVAAFSDSDPTRRRLYYEVTLPGASPRCHELDPRIRPGDGHRVAVLEMATRQSWWRVWVDGKAVSPPLYLPGSHGTWY